MAQAVAKICQVCGRDVSATKRVRDQRSNYFCQPCFDASSGNGQASGPAGPSGANPAHAGDESVPQPSTDSRAVAADCANCGKRFGKIERTFFFNNHTVCVVCLELLRLEEQIQGPPANQDSAETDAERSQPFAPDTATTQAPKKRLISLEAEQYFCRLGAAVFGVCTLLSLAVGALFSGNTAYWTALVTGLIAAGLLLVLFDMPSLAGKSHGDIKVSRKAIGLALFQCTTVAVFGSMFAFLAWDRTSEWWDWARIVSSGTILLVALCLIWMCVRSLRLGRCPSCHLFSATIVTNTQALGSQEFFVDRIERVHVHEGVGIAGKIESTIAVPVKDRYLKTALIESCSCRFCAHQWSRQRTVTSKG